MSTPPSSVMKPAVKFFAISHRIIALTRSSLSVYELSRRYSSASSRADAKLTLPGSSAGTPPMALSSNHHKNSSAWGQSQPFCSVMVRGVRVQQPFRRAAGIDETLSLPGNYIPFYPRWRDRSKLNEIVSTWHLG